MKEKSCPTLCDPVIVAYQAPLSMRFSRQEYRSGLPFPSPICFRSVSAAEGAACPTNLFSLLFLGNDTPVLFRQGCAKLLQSCLTLCDTTDFHPPPPQVPMSVGFSRQEYWSGLPCLPPGDLPDPGIEDVSASYASCIGRQALYC